MFRIRLKLRISLINKVPEIVDCSKLHDFYDELYEEIRDTNLKKVIECQEAQRIKMHNFIMSKVIEKSRSFFKILFLINTLNLNIMHNHKR